jgi:hypothetical protein
MAYYKNTKVVAQEVGLPVSGTILVKPGYYVAGAYFAQYATAGILTEETDGDTITALDAGDLDAYIVYNQPATAGASTVGTTSIIDGTIAAADIASNAVTTAKINALAVTTAKIAADAVDGTKIADDSIDSEHIAADSLDTEHYAPLSVDAAALAADAVTTAKILDANVTTAKIADLNVTTGKLAAGAVTPLKGNFLTTAPASASATGVAGEIRFAAGFIYICTATDTWERVATATW